MVTLKLLAARSLRRESNIMESVLVALQKLKIAFGIALCVVGIAGTLVPVIPGVPIILTGAALMGADHPLVLRVKQMLKSWKAGRTAAAKE
jgi:hypothetical protein